MKTVTQKIKYCQFLIKYSIKYGVTKAAIKYDVTQQYIYFRKRQYDGTLQSLADRSHRPEHHPNLSIVRNLFPDLINPNKQFFF